MIALSILNPVIAFLVLARIGIDIWLFFLIVRWVQSIFHTRLLSGMDRVGRPMVDTLVDAIRKTISRIAPERHPTEASLVAMSILLMSMCGFTISMVLEYCS